MQCNVFVDVYEKQHNHFGLAQVSVCVECECACVIRDDLECDSTQCLACLEMLLVPSVAALSMFLVSDGHPSKNPLIGKSENAIMDEVCL